MKYFIVEGIDGIGKTTAIENIKKQMEAEGKKVMVIREPGSTKLGEDMRSILKGGQHNLDRMQEFFLFSAGRASNYAFLKELRKEEGANETTVISDRSFLSSIAYQGEDIEFARFIESTSFAIIENYQIVPDKVIILKGSIDEIEERKLRLHPEGDHFEDGKRKTAEDRQKRYEEYFKRSVNRKFSDRQLYLLDVTGMSEDETASSIRSRMEE